MPTLCAPVKLMIGASRPEVRWMDRMRLLFWSFPDEIAISVGSGVDPLDFFTRAPDTSGDGGSLRLTSISWSRTRDENG